LRRNDFATAITACQLSRMDTNESNERLD
jgi:hypothetical protein